MKNVTFNITASRFRNFTAAQETKVKEGLALFQKAVEDARFKEKVCNFVWTSESGNAFNRFLMSKGMSNMQVFETICNTTGKMMNDTMMMATGDSTMVCNIVPCCNKNEYVYCCTNTPMTTVCINTNMLNQDWYTPVHVAACIMHEWCVCKGFCCTTNGTLVSDYPNTVPYACGKTMMQVIKEVCAKDPQVSMYVSQINETNFDCCPCSTSWATDTTVTECVNVCEQVDQVVSALEMEMDMINCISNKSKDEVNRMTVLTNCITTMKDVKNRLTNTSLDGTETVMMPTVERRRVMVGL